MRIHTLLFPVVAAAAKAVWPAHVFGRNQRSPACVALGCICALAQSPRAEAGPILETYNYARFYSASDPNVSYACSNSNGVACGGSAKAPGTNWTVNYAAQGESRYGFMHGQASVFLTGDNSLGTFSSFESTGARAGFRDVYTIGGASGAGTINFMFAVTGSKTQTSGAFGNNIFQLVPVSNGQEDFGHLTSYSATNGTATIPVSFTFGQATEFTLYFYSLAQVHSWQTGASATADYTATLNQIGVLDSQGRAVQNFSVATASGTVYSASGAVPEPATGLQLAAAGVVLWAVRKRLWITGE